MTRPAWLRQLADSWRFTFVSASLVATMVLSTAAAYQLHASLREHERSVDRLLHEYARYTSRMYGEALMRFGQNVRLQVLAAPLTLRLESAAEAMPLERFEEHASDALREHGRLGDPWLGFYRLVLATGEFEGSGSLARPGTKQAVRARLAEVLASEGIPESDGMTRMELDGEPFTLMFAAQRTREGEPVVVLGVLLDRRHSVAANHRQVMERVSLYPPSMISPRSRYEEPVANDSLVSIEDFDHAGRLLFRSENPYQSSVRGEFVFNTAPGGFLVRSTLNPRVVEQIRAEHRPDTRRRYALLLPFVSLLLGISAIVHLLRERELVRARRDFVASVSHELRTPLAQIQIFAETLLRGRERSEAERQRWLGVISREAYRMGGLVENILMFSHLERAELRLAREPTDLKALVHDVLDTFEPLIRTHDASVVAELPEDLVLDVDPRAIRQVLGNLLDNALKYGPRGQTIRIAAVPTSADRVLVSVSDQGPGVPPAARDRVWLPFQRLTHEGGSAGGSGLGLAVVGSLVAQHGGTVFVDDAPGGGARFVVTLPRFETHTPAPVARPVANAARG